MHACVRAVLTYRLGGVRGDHDLPRRAVDQLRVHVAVGRVEQQLESVCRQAAHARRPHAAHTEPSRALVRGRRGRGRGRRGRDRR